MTIAADQVNVYCFALDRPTEQSDWSILSCDEIERARRFVRPEHSSSYVTAHAQLRRILANHLNVPAQQLNFAHGKHGKPYLPEHQLHFNLSHTAKMGLVAVGATPLGVDIEQIRDIDAISLAQRFFHCQEANWIAEQNDSNLAFCRIWTRKEAVVKAIGTGITEHLDKFTVLSTGACPIKFLHPEQTWHLYDLASAGQHLAALAHNSANCQIKLQAI